MGNQGKKNSSNYIIQGSILSIASIVVRVIGMLYRLPVTNIIGNTGNSYYSTAFEVYNIILLISSYSLPLAVSKLVSARAVNGEYKNARRIFKGALIFASAAGIAGGLIAFFGADFFTGLLNTPEGALSLKVLAPTIFVVAVMGVFRGYFQGLGTMIPTAISQVIEQIVNAVVSIVAAYYLFVYGTGLDLKAGIEGGTRGAEYGAAGSTLGTSLGALAGLLFVVAVMFMYQRVQKRQLRHDGTRELEDYKSIFYILIMTIVPVILSSAVYNVNGIIDQGLFKFMMIDLKETAKADVDVMWGIYTGKYKLLTNVPVAIASALAASTVPALTAARIAGNRQEMKRKVETSTRFVMIVTIPCAVGLAVLAAPILELLFGDTDPMTRMMFYVGTSAVVFYALSTLTNGILQGIDRMQIPVRNALIALGIHTVFLVFFVLVLDWNIYGIIYSYIIFAVIMCILNALAIRRYLKYRQELVRTFVIPAAASAIMGGAAWLIHYGLSKALDLDFLGRRVQLGISVFVTVTLAAGIYGVFLLLLRGVTESELKSFPKGRTLVRIAKKLHLLPAK